MSPQIHITVFGVCVDLESDQKKICTMMHGQKIKIYEEHPGSVLIWVHALLLMQVQFFSYQTPLTFKQSILKYYCFKWRPSRVKIEMSKYSHSSFIELCSALTQKNFKTGILHDLVLKIKTMYMYVIAAKQFDFFFKLSQPTKFNVL